MRRRNIVLPFEFSWHYWGSPRGTLGLQSSSFENTDPRENVPGKAYRILSENQILKKLLACETQKHLGVNWEKARWMPVPGTWVTTEWAREPLRKCQERNQDKLHLLYNAVVNWIQRKMLALACSQPTCGVTHSLLGSTLKTWEGMRMQDTFFKSQDDLVLFFPITSIDFLLLM